MTYEDYLHETALAYAVFHGTVRAVRDMLAKGHINSARAVDILNKADEDVAHAHKRLDEQFDVERSKRDRAAAGELA